MQWLKEGETITRGLGTRSFSCSVRCRRPGCSDHLSPAERVRAVPRGDDASRLRRPRSRAAAFPAVAAGLRVQLRVRHPSAQGLCRRPRVRRHGRRGTRPQEAPPAGCRRADHRSGSAAKPCSSLCRDLRYSDREKLALSASLAVTLAERTKSTEGGPAELADLQARAWAELGNVLSRRPTTWCRRKRPWATRWSFRARGPATPCCSPG